VVSDATVRELREVDDNYPQWVLGQYIQVPPEVTTRTRELAIEISEGLTNTYDIAPGCHHLFTREYYLLRIVPPTYRWTRKYSIGSCSI